ncbi:Crp/Fnr family transcriptional regulator [Chitinophaga barathri]|uniref:Crp/Fnr family transcriptional regulator n=1 Tax=Chitinophaga barathri TaxID=1647451 RepID=A0A3N4MBB8_9BACT|nr:Crp/Fnr family transcriptional regulator [Chitinophaga barathri]RPD40901.1 Crp/Fnr family transcriptional regulator [Chitinophaga barathri]
MQQHFLANIFKEGQFTAQELETIIPRFSEVRFEKNAFLLAEGKTAGNYWFVQQGYIRSFAIDTEGDDISTNFYTTGDIVIDWTSFFLRKPTRENIQALTDCVCWQLDFETFQQLFHSIESFREAGRKRLVESYFELKSHNISMISDQAKDRYKRLVKEKPQIVQNVSLKQIATYLGITDTSLSRIRKEIASE